jgi:tetratricopeptide (TPR) repeat protein
MAKKSGDAAAKAPVRSGRAPSARPKSGERRARAGHKAGPKRTVKKAREDAPKPRSPRSTPSPTPEEMLQRAMAATTPRGRALWARRGLASRRRIDRTTQSMLLRQLYLAYFEARRFAKALEISRQALELDVLPDVVHQDAARAAQALGDVDAAAGHLRLAARSGPAKRRAFHWWTLGSLYLCAGRHADAISALTRAARWGTTDKPLYQGHLAVARCAAGEVVDDLSELIERLEQVPAGQGYGRFVLGHLAFHAGRRDDARRWLSAFVERSEGGRPALAIALDAEIALARATLAKLD